MANIQPQRNSSRVIRLFVWTAVAAVIFSVGLILGQRMLIEHELPPAVATEAAAPDAEKDDDDDVVADDAVGAELFSFYEALTTADDEPGGDAADQRDDSEPTKPQDDPADEDPADDVVADKEDGVEEGDPTGAARYTLRVATHSTMEQARTEMDRLETLDLNPMLVTTAGPDGDKIYLVQIGKFPDEDEARAYGNRLQTNHDLQALVSPL